MRAKAGLECPANEHQRGGQTRVSDYASLTKALFAIYAIAGREVYYVTDKGETRPYWANRFRQALQRAVEQDDVVGFVERLVQQPDPSRGFGYLNLAGRLDLSVEAVVTEQYPQLFSSEVVKAARERLRDHGYEPGARTEITLGRESDDSREPLVIDLRVTVGDDGKATAEVIG